MANEELQQRGYISSGQFKGDVFGSFEYLNLGSTRLDALVAAGIPVTLPLGISYACLIYKPPKTPAALKPDQLYLQRRSGQPIPVAICEHKKSGTFSGKTGGGNLSSSVLPANYSFYQLVGDPAKFKASTGVTEIEYYVNQIRPKIKSIFPDNTLCDDAEVPNIFGMKTVVSKTSIINGFVFLQSGNQTHERGLS